MCGRFSVFFLVHGGGCFELKGEYGGFLHCEWFTAKTKKAARCPRDQNLVVGVRFPGERGGTSAGLSKPRPYKILLLDFPWHLTQGPASALHFNYSARSSVSLV